MMYIPKGVRLDKFLAVARLVKQRTQAKDLCDGGHVKLDGKTAKAAHDVDVGDVLDVTLPRRHFAVRVAAVPVTKGVPKAAAPDLYEVITDERTGNYLEPGWE